MSTLWINAGELSGDVQAGALLTALARLDPTLKAVGMGGDNLARAGQDNLFRVEELSVMGVVEVLTSLPRILRRRIRAKLAEARPDAVLLVDAPDFNFRVARMAHALGIPVYYFIPPKLWAWRSGRVRFLRRHVRRVFSILPFEVDFYRRHDMDVVYVGNPLVDLVDRASIDAVRPVPGRIGVMPGSRRKEVESLLPAFSGAADLLLPRFPHLEFHCICAVSGPAPRLCAFNPPKAAMPSCAPASAYWPPRARPPWKPAWRGYPPWWPTKSIRCPPSSAAGCSTCRGSV